VFVPIPSKGYPLLKEREGLGIDSPPFEILTKGIELLQGLLSRGGAGIFEGPGSPSQPISFWIKARHDPENIDLDLE